MGIKYQGAAGPAGRPDRYGLGVPSVTEVLSDMGAGADLSRADPAAVERKGRIGASAHATIAWLLGGDAEPKLDPEAEPYVDSWMKWAAWMDLCGAESGALVEVPLSVVVQDGDGRVVWGLAGTFDYVGPGGIGRRRRIIMPDWKCRGTTRSDLLQAAAYRWLARHAPASKHRSLRTMAEVAEVMAVSLQADGSPARARTEETAGGALEQEFAGLVRRWWRRHGEEIRSTT